MSITVSNIAEPGRTLNVNAVVDTAFTAHLTLPLVSIEHLGLLSRGKQPAILANGLVGDFPVYAGLASWGGHRRLIPIFESDSEPLLGMAMLWGSRLVVDAWEGGAVVIEEVPR